MSFRFDSAPIANWEELPDGRLRIMATISRVGDLTYRQADGSDRTETLTADELFAPTWLDSIATAPVTLRHPPEPVTPANFKKYAVGMSGSKVIARQDAGLVDVLFTVADSEAIAAIKDGTAREVSAGYSVRIEKGDDGKLYQKDRYGNHLAIVPKGRAGESVRLHFDAADDDVLFQVDQDIHRGSGRTESRYDAAWTANKRDRLKRGEIKGGFAGPKNSYPIASRDDVGDAWGLAGQTGTGNPDSIRRKIIQIAKRHGWTDGLPDTARQWADDNRIRIDGGSNVTQILIGKRIFNVDGEDASALSEAIALLSQSEETAKAELSAAKTELEQVKSETAAEKARADAAEGKATGLQTRLDEAQSVRMDEEAIASAIQERMDVWALVLPTFRRDDSSFQPDYKRDAAEVRKDYLVKIKPELRDRLDSATPEFISGLWEALKPAPEQARVDSTSELAGVIDIVTRNDMGGYGKGKENPMTARRKSRAMPGTPAMTR
ncbi:DUF2213 domain-containing protein [Thermoleptolyngbya sp. M55_K2018_002]|uniref:DUF2213 domain-containing protein n=1 Tax=Thermoleptolyngbya sp. M55_K2018_002 TaxID=2747808 RepID=UPI0019E4F7C2|nr:DUF2213 domain-containing protein [Thermoleptolyngbya sp. M55_K2018_002]HIK42168.1 DUF2213 domain-containing protein [Thermoleptolyngbya sp. M55_K2018_002]